VSKTVEFIKADHRKVEQLFAEFRQTQQYAVAEEICIELRVHTAFEEELVYPLLRSKVSSDEAQHAQEEHDEAKQIIDEILETDASGEQLVQLMTKLEKAISHHVEEEENEILPEMDQKVGQEMEDIYPQVVQRKKELMEEEQQDEEALDLSEAELQERAARQNSQGN